MIHLNTLKLTHFMCVDSAEFDFTQNNVTLITGIPAQGKSTVFEAIGLCFVERRRGDSYKDYIQHGYESANVNLTATIFDEPISFDIEITSKGTALNRLIEYKKKKYVNSECSPLLESFDINYLGHNMFSMQGEGSVVNLRPAERAKLLKRILNVEFPTQVDFLTEQIEKAEQEISTLRAQLDVLNNRTFIYQPEVSELTSIEKNRILARIKEIDIEIKNLERVQNLQLESHQQLDNLKSQKETILQRKSSIEKEITQKENSIVKFNTDLSTYRSKLSTLPDIESCNVLIKGFQDSITLKKGEVSSIQEDIEANLKSTLELKGEIQTLTTHIAAHKQGVCINCGQKTNPQSVPELLSQLDSKNLLLVSLQESKTQKTKKVQSLNTEISQLESSLSSNKSNIQLAENVKPQYLSLISSTESSIRNEENSISNLKSSLCPIVDQLNLLTSQINGISVQEIDNSKLVSLKTELTSLNESIQNNRVNEEVNKSIKKSNEVVRLQEIKNKTDIDQNTKQQEKLTLDIFSYKESKKVFEVDLPNYIIVKMCSKLEKNINKFICKVMPNVVVRLFQSRSGVEFFYSAEGVPASVDGWTSAKMSSGFERELLSIAWRVALAKAYKLKLMLLDEIDSAADVSLSDTMFKELVKLPDFDQLFIISHKPELAEVIQQEVPNVSTYNVVKGKFYQQTY